VPSVDKVLDLPELAERIAALKTAGRVVGLANGGFDLFHVGHVRYLSEARRRVDVLVVAINSDRSLRGLKGDHRALLAEGERARLVAALRCVDFVTVFDQPTVEQVLRTLEPAFHLKGSDYTVDTVPEREIVRSFGGEVVIVGGPKVRSTSVVLDYVRSLPR
jgi:D-glycero-beta-D-manno-heptose 1-phosphate adenylyltransferase